MLRDSLRHAHFASLLFLALAGCEVPPAVQVETISINVQGDPRTFRLVLPAELPQSPPLVIAWHGFGDTPESMADYSGLDRLAAEHHFVLAYPAGIRGSWRVPMPDAPNTNADADVQLFDALLDQLSAAHDLDADRIYVVGMSQGAIFAQWLASQRPDKIAAVAAHSGSPPKVLDLSTAEVPVLLIAGQEDLVHDRMQEAAQQYEAAGCEAQFISVPNLGHAWSAAQNEAIWAFLARHTRKNEGQN